MSVQYYYRTLGTDRNPWTIAVVLGDYPIDRLIRRGVKPSMHITSRPFTDEESERDSKRWRCTMYTYTSLDGLIEDETKILGKDHPVLVELTTEINFRAKFHRKK